MSSRMHPVLPQLYGRSLALLTDLYELTMAYGYWKSGQAERRAVFHLTYRENPFGGGFAIACGLRYAAELLEGFHFEEDDLRHLSSLCGSDGRRLFEPAFLDYLREMRFCCDVDGIPEGVAVFPRQPLVRVEGPLAQSQIIETPLLTILNFQTLIATKAARICRAAGGQPVLEFGLRRAQGIDGGLAASRAAYIGGCAATSNVLAGRLFGIPVRGTHAHSWVMAFEDELSAFEAYAEAMPNNCIFLVDTYDTLEGVRKAVRAAARLRKRGYELVGVRLDSGDLVALSRRAREILDQAGFPGVRIVASNDLDEYRIRALRRAGAAIDIWGVGTRLAAAYDQPALGGVYKLGALQDRDGRWRCKVKLSDEPGKESDPGLLQVRRFIRDGSFWGDALYDLPTGIAERPELIDPRGGRRIQPPEGAEFEDLLRPLFRDGRLVAAPPEAEEARRVRRRQLEMLPDAVQRLERPAMYRVLLEPRLDALKSELAAAARARRMEG